MGRDSDCNLCLLQLDLAGNARPSRRPPSFHDETAAEAPGARPHVCEPVPPVRRSRRPWPRGAIRPAPAGRRSAGELETRRPLHSLDSGLVSIRWQIATAVRR